MILLYLCVIALEFLIYWELRKLRELNAKKLQEPNLKTPPKARNSFVVKRMEERLKEALYE